MNNKDLQRMLAKKIGITQTDASKNLTALIRCMGQCFINGDTISISRLGTLEPRTKAERSAKMPNAKESIIIPQRTDIVLRVTNTYKDRLKENKQ